MGCHCTDHEAVAPARSWPSWLRGMVALVKWALPITTLALVPKCPMCVAAYVLLFTGIGVSLPVAAAMRWAFMALSIGAIAYLAFRAVRRVLCLGTRRRTA
jgi:hypothetical protein